MSSPQARCRPISYQALISITNARFWTGLRTFFSLPPAVCACLRSALPPTASAYGSLLPEVVSGVARLPHPPVLPLPVVERLFADPILSADLTGLYPGFRLL